MTIAINIVEGVVGLSNWLAALELSFFQCSNCANGISDLLSPAQAPTEQ